jgi:TRAP-type C4-dicarboxylate transport system substrate-binding protein
VIPNPVFLDPFKAFKANPVPMSCSVLYTAPETKTVDGQENPYSVILSNKFYEVQKFLSRTNHVYGTSIILVRKKFWDKLSPAEHDRMRQIAKPVSEKALATYDPAIQKLYASEVERVQKIK